jgi:hypothetical protein
MVCPAKSAYDLHKAWPESKLFWVPDAGHSVQVRRSSDLGYLGTYSNLLTCTNTGTGNQTEIDRGMR